MLTNEYKINESQRMKPRNVRMNLRKGDEKDPFTFTAFL